MRTLGILGGMSWESTALYYRAINQGVAARLGGLHSAPLLLHSVDFAPVAAAQAAGDWTGLAARMADAARGLARAGAQGLLIATNTMHRLAPDVALAAGVPLLHIADPAGRAVRDAGLRRVGLLGTRFTMEEASVVREPLVRRHGLEIVLPPPAGRETVHRVIYEELCRGQVLPASRRAFVQVIEGLRAQGAEGVILGCTEITMLLGAGDSPLPVFDTTALHAAAAVDWILEDDR